MTGWQRKKHTVGLEPTISCSVGKRLIQLGYACSYFRLNISYLLVEFSVISTAKKMGTEALELNRDVDYGYSMRKAANETGETPERSNCFLQYKL